MVNDPSLPDPSVVLDLIEAFPRSKTMFVAASLGVFDALSAGPRSAEALARDLHLNLNALTQLLDGCVGLQLLAKAADRYGNTPVAPTYLSPNSPPPPTSPTPSSNPFPLKY